MKKTIKLVALVATLGIAVSVPPASAVGAGILFVAPFEAPEPTQISSVRIPCEIAHSVAGGSETDPAAGTFAPLSASVEVYDCVSHSFERIEEWNLGDVLLPLVGQPATIIADLEIDDAVCETSGSGDLEASITLSLAGGDDQDIAVARRSGDGSATVCREGLVQVIEQTDALPATLNAVWRAQASASDATGRATASISGTLRQVVVVPLV